MKHKTLLKNIYYMALYHRDRNMLRSLDLTRDDVMRAKDQGLCDAYAYVVQMVVHMATIGSTDYKKVHKMDDTFPKILYDK